VLLKIYHIDIPIEYGIKEFKMLHKAKSAASIIKVNSLIYSVEDSFIALSL